MSDTKKEARKSTRTELVLDTAYADGEDLTILGVPTTYDIQMFINEHPFYTRDLQLVDYAKDDEGNPNPDLIGIGWVVKFREEFVEFVEKYWHPDNKHTARQFVERIGLDNQAIDFLVYWRDYSKASFLSYKKLPEIK